MHSQPFPAPAHKLTAHVIYWSQKPRCAQPALVRALGGTWALPRSEGPALQGPKVLALRAGARGRNQPHTRLPRGAALGAASPVESLLAAALVPRTGTLLSPAPSAVYVPVLSLLSPRDDRLFDD